MSDNINIENMSFAELQELEKKLSKAIPKATKNDRVKAYKEIRDLAVERGFDVKDLVDEFYRKKDAPSKIKAKKSSSKSASKATEVKAENA